MPPHILWDIDGTLVRGGRAVADAYLKALRAIYRLEGEIARVSMTGKTDGQIAIETLAHHGLSETETLDLLTDFRDLYTVELDRVRHQLAEEINVLPGVPAALDRLAVLGVRQTLLTGNFETTARIKLASAGLDHYFDFAIGAFGSDHHDRDCLVPIALEKARRVHGLAIAPEQALVIGDTPRDIACARAGGAHVIAVATGRVTADKLAACQPDTLLLSLEDTEAALAAILAERSAGAGGG